MWNDEWLSKRTEEVLDPSVEIVDAHHHLWEGKPGLPDYLFPAFKTDVEDGHRVTQAVYVDCGWSYRSDGPEHLRPVGETEAVAAIADAEAFPDIAGIVSYADLAARTLAEVLDAHEAAGRGRFRGVRASVAYDLDESIRRPKELPPPELMDGDEFRAGLALLGERGLPCDVFLYHLQIPQLTSAARAVPDTTIILNHLGAPLSVGRHAGRRQEVLAEWRESVSELSQCPNVVMKIGGLGWTPMGFGHEKLELPASSQEIADAWRPFVSHALASFGPQRCLAESNFPVDQATCTYRTLWNAIKLLLADLEPEERQQVLSETARTLYRL